jgi:hypothetical protein
LAAVLLLAAAGVLLHSCSGTVNNPETAVRKTIRAYGGEEKARRLSNFIGKGFMKNLSSRSVASSYVFDVYQSGNRFKHIVMKTTRGNLSDVIVTFYDGEQGYQYKYSEGRKDLVAWEVSMVKYRFPFVLTWMLDSGLTGEVVTGSGDEGECLLRYENKSDIVTLAIDSKSWRLKEVEVKSVTDSSFAYKEAYDNYREVGGVPFPGRFTGFYRGSRYFEFFLPSIEWGVDLPDSVFSVLVGDTVKVERLNPAGKK